MRVERPTEQDSERDTLQHRNRGLATLLEVSRKLATTLQLEEVLQAATDGVTRLHALKTAAVYLGEGDVLRLWATTPPLPPDFPDDLRLVSLADHPHLSEALTSGLPVFLPDTATADLTARRSGRHRPARVALGPLPAAHRPASSAWERSSSPPRANG